MPFEESKISDLSREGEWVSLEAKVIQFWEAKSDSISQIGLLADETGKIKFISWKKSNLPILDNGGKTIIVNGSTAEKIAGMDLEKAKNMEKKEIDHLSKSRLVGKTYIFRGRAYEKNFVVNEFEEVGE